MGRVRPVGEKRRREKEMVAEMIALYCRGRHGSRGTLCPQCAELAAYDAGPRILVHHPVAAVRHALSTLREKKRLEGER